MSNTADGNVEMGTVTAVPVMIPASNGAFYSRPEQERCQAQLAGCTGNQALRIHCTVEGTDITVCANCAAVWRLNASSDSLYNRCPRCANWNPGAQHIATRPVTAGAQEIPEGPVADAINTAMHAEGLTIDIRNKVLQRLARNAPGLFG